MGAAFMVALLLIYILVVWEFGNFRIPLVIMAPIPLTLLGIIPAHFIMFELGLGGEFTATSMIGWIALAGIIVRNSILLVDFSIHEIQRGIPVAEAVIRACKVRARPILITALALVAGSSVIITDPIFQGMAISLLAGTIVSTVLTLIVIPLGCVARSRDLCEVAAATAAHLPPGGLPCQAEAERPAPSAAEAHGGGGLTTVLAKLGEVLTLVFYGLRGIVLLLIDLAKNAFRPKPPPRPRRPRPVPPDGSVAASPSGTVSVSAATTSPATQLRSGLVMVEPDAPGSAAVTPAPAAAPPASAPAPGTATKTPSGKKPPARKSTPARAAAAPPAKEPGQPAQKKSPRRGIRLKVDDEPHGEGN